MGEQRVSTPNSRPSARVTEIEYFSHVRALPLQSATVAGRSARPRPCERPLREETRVSAGNRARRCIWHLDRFRSRLLVAAAVPNYGWCRRRGNGSAV